MEYISSSLLYTFMVIEMWRIKIIRKLKLRLFFILNDQIYLKFVIFFYTISVVKKLNMGFETLHNSCVLEVISNNYRLTYF